MNYDAHLARHAELERQKQAEHDAMLARRQIALEEGMRDAQDLITGIIQPELEELRRALVAHGTPARITLTREVSELTADSSFALAIELKEDGASRRLTFTAIPQGRYFEVSMVAALPPAKPHHAEMKFQDATPAAVQSHCAGFLRQAFPADY